MLDAAKIEKPFRKLRKLLKDFPENPPPRAVHSLRTETRRLQAVFLALTLHADPAAHRLLKTIQPLRKAAGRVRDMDVLIANVLSLDKSRDDAGLVTLIQHLAQLRSRSSVRLLKTIARRGRKARKRLKQCTRVVQSRLEQAPPDTLGAHSAGARILATELCHWPRLAESNVHQFRIQVKELAYVLQFSRDADPRLLQRLTQVKDSIGDWHDWRALMDHARQALDPVRDKKLLARLRSLERQKLRAALLLARSVRRQDLAAPSARSPKTKGPTLVRAAGR